MLTEKPFPLAQLAGLPGRIPHPVDPLGAFYVCSMHVISHYLGLKWLERWVMTGKKRSGHFQTWDTPGNMEHAVDQVVQLAELLLSLQEMIGFWSMLRTLHGSGPEVGISELSAGILLQGLGIDFSFRKATGQKGSDYDLDVRLPGMAICGETKCKSDRTAFSLSSLKGSINKARKNNLPRDFPGLVFVIIPEQWLSDTDRSREIDTTIKAYLGQARSLVGVMLMSRARVVTSYGVTSLQVSKFIRNERCRFDHDSIGLLEFAPKQMGVSLVNIWGKALLKSQYEPNLRLLESLRALQA